MKKFLITGYYFNGYHGSMMHICELAEHLKKLGYKVFIASFYIDESIKKELIKKTGINVYFFNDLPLNTEYDYVLGYHEPLLAYLISKGLKYKHIGVGCLSYAMKGVEMPSMLTKFEAPIFVCSKELKNKIEKELFLKNIHVVPNFVPESFCKENKTKRKLKNIAVVSNHIPKEVLDLEKIFNEKKININYYGQDHTHKKITPKILEKYDLIITIGKTVQYSLALGIPVYNYDIHGGSGYINLTNFEDIEYYNFSGRNNPAKKTSQELAEDIIDNYQLNLNITKDLQLIVQKKYSINTLVQDILTTMENNKIEIKETAEWKIYKEHCKQLFEVIFFNRELLLNIYPYLKKQLIFYKKINQITFKKCFKNKIKNLETLLKLTQMNI